MQNSEVVVVGGDADGTTTRASQLDSNLQAIRDRITKATSSSRSSSIVVNATDKPISVRLVAVSKTKPASDILSLYFSAAAHRHFGENVQELVEKAQQLPKDIQWHFIGTLQSNKCKLVASIPNVAVVETVGSKKTADALNKAIAKLLTDKDPAYTRQGPLSIFIQVNTSGEDTKGGIEPMDVVDVAEYVVKECTHLKLAGLMTIGSPDASRANESNQNPDFKCLIECRGRIEETLPQLAPLELSMGMSDDFELAIRSGSTNVRVGSLIFGNRNYNK